MIIIIIIYEIINNIETIDCRTIKFLNQLHYINFTLILRMYYKYIKDVTYIDIKWEHHGSWYIQINGRCKNK